MILEIPTLMSLPPIPSCSVVSGPFKTCTREENNQLRFEYASNPTSTALEVNLY